MGVERRTLRWFGRRRTRLFTTLFIIRTKTEGDKGIMALNKMLSRKTIFQEPKEEVQDLQLCMGIVLR